jgi:hypothetical protein
MKKVNWQYLIDALLFISVAAVAAVGFLLGFVIPKGPSGTDSAKYFLGLHRHDWGDIHLYLGISFAILAVVHLFLGWNWIKAKTHGLFHHYWKVTLTAMCLLPLVVLAVSWACFPGEPSIYTDSESGAVRPDRGILEAGAVPPYNPSNAFPTTHGHSSTSAKTILKATESDPRIGNEMERRTNQHSNEEDGSTRRRGSENISGILITGQMTLRDIEERTGISARVLADGLGLPRGAYLDDRLGRLRKKYRFTMQDVRDIIASLLEQRSTL